MADFIEIFYCKFLTKFVSQIQVCLKFGKVTSASQEYLRIFLVISRRFTDM